MTPACATFVEAAAELALGTVDGRQREELLAHAADCPSCQGHLDSLMLVADRLLLLSPEIEPPPGFESRVLDNAALASAGAASRLADGARARVVAATAQATDGLGSRARTRRRWRVVGAAAAVAAIAVPAVAVAAHRTTPATHAVEQGAIVRVDGTRSGTIRLLDRPRPMVLITIDKPRRFNGRVTCELIDRDGQVTTVGTWSADDIANGVWAVGIDADLLNAVRMNVRDPAGALASSAELR